MIHEPDLMRAIIATPDDDAPRLVYADWLDENVAEERAEFIRVQCELERLPFTDKKAAKLRQREQSLLQQHSWAWAEHLSGAVSEWKYRRGFVEYAHMYLETDRDSIVSVLKKEPIRHIRDTGQFCDLTGVVDALPDFKNLTGLEFWGLYAFEDKLLETILTSRHLKNLRTLILHHDRNGNTVKDSVLIKAVKHPARKNIVQLALNVDGSWRGPSRKVCQAIAASPHLRKLRHLTLSNAGDTGNQPEMDVKTLKALGASPNLAKLEWLDMGRTSFDLAGWDEVLKWPFLAKLKYLRLHYARQVEIPSVMTVAELQNLPTYRDAIAAKVKNIDWDSDFITPWDENTGWRGQSWAGLSEAHLFNMWPFIERGDYDGLEKTYRADCLKYAGAEATAAIDALDFKKYQQTIYAGYERAVKAAGRRRTLTSITFRLRPDLSWDGQFGLGTGELEEPFTPRQEFSYNSPTVEYSGGRFKEAAEVRDRFPRSSQLDPGAVRHYSLARTINALAKCMAKTKSPVPVFFSCMYALFRLPT